MVTIVIDPSHGGTKRVGGSDPNHVKGPSGLLEKTITLDLAWRMAQALENSGHTVVPHPIRRRQYRPCGAR